MQGRKGVQIDPWDDPEYEFYQTTDRYGFIQWVYFQSMNNGQLNDDGSDDDGDGDGDDDDGSDDDSSDDYGSDDDGSDDGSYGDVDDVGSDDDDDDDVDGIVQYVVIVTDKLTSPRTWKLKCCNFFLTQLTHFNLVKKNIIGIICRIIGVILFNSFAGNLLNVS